MRQSDAQRADRHAVMSEVAVSVLDIEHRLHGLLLFQQKINVAAGAVFGEVVILLALGIFEYGFGVRLLRPLNHFGAAFERLTRFRIVGHLDILGDVVAIGSLFLGANEHFFKLLFTQTIETLTFERIAFTDVDDVFAVDVDIEIKFDFCVATECGGTDGHEFHCPGVPFKCYDRGMDDILKEFVDESKGLIDQMIEILETVESDPSQLKQLETYGQIVDRIMGGSKVLALDYPFTHPVHSIANFSELCKLVGYKASQVTNNSHLITVVIAFLLDATETLQALNTEIMAPEPKRVSELLTATFLDRLQWLAKKFDENLRSSVAITKSTAKSTQDDIDALLKQMGVGVKK